MFKQLQEALQARYDALAKDCVAVYRDVDRELVWEAYLSGFSGAEVQAHQCNSCRSFIRQYSGLTFIDKDYKAHSVWSISPTRIPDEYKGAVKKLREFVEVLPVTDKFLHPTAVGGTPQNKDGVRNLVWYHFAIKFADASTREDLIPSTLGPIRDEVGTLMRSLGEISVDAFETVIQLADQNSIYRGEELAKAVRAVFILKQEYDKLDAETKYNFAWWHVLKGGIPKNLRGSAIGTLLVDLTEGKPLDAAVNSYEVKVAPENYKRTSALITPKMIEDAKKTLTELNLLDSLDRRFATETELDINDLLFINKEYVVTDVFGDMAKETKVDLRKLSKVEEMTINDFIEKVLPSAKHIEVLLENKHLNNLFSLTTAQNAKAENILKWPNPFAWAYAGGVTDSMKENVKAAGGKVDGILRFSIQWNDEDTKGYLDFDAHAYEPRGEHIYFSAGYRKDRGDKRTAQTGQLDVDMTGGPTVQVENITWTNLAKMKDGDYRFVIHNFSGARQNKGFKAQVEFNGEIHDFYHGDVAMGYIDIATVTLTKGVFTIKNHLPSTSNVQSKSKWGVSTHTFTKVKSMFLSPNFWKGEEGNKHFMFQLDGCINDEKVLPFFNEYIRHDLTKHRKVFEVMASKLSIQPTTNQVSGVGFSVSQRNSLIVQVTGAFKRQIKILF